jgi:hypothetical protein
MLFKKLFVIVSVVIALTYSGGARADPITLTALREGVRGLEVRSKAVRTLAERANNPAVLRTIDRILRVIDEKRASLAMRLAVVELLGSEGVEPRVLYEITSYFLDTSKMLARVESWFEIH